MKKIQTISLLVMAITLAACNEKVSPELQDANVVAPTPPPVALTSYTFKVSSTSNPALEYMLHKTGNTFKPDPILTSDDCEVKKLDTPFKRADFGKSQYNMIDPTDADELLTVNDITCYLEAEELGLYIDGMKLKVEATPGACTYVRYSPYSYYNRKPGNSSGTYKKVSCAPDTNATHIAEAFTASPGDITYAGGLTADCGDYLIDSRKASNNVTNIPIAAADRVAFRVDPNDDTADLESEEQLCRFNYSDLGEEKCDVGKIDIFDHTVTYNKTAAELDAATHANTVAIGSNSLLTSAPDYNDSSDDDGAGPDDGSVALVPAEISAIQGTAEYASEYQAAYDARLLATLGAFTTKNVTKRTINCGGKVHNCAEGAIKSHANIASPNGGLISNIISTANAYTQEYTYGTLNPDREGTYVYANFRRELANSNLAYPINIEDTSIYTDFADIPYMNAFDPSAVESKIFEPRVLDRYTANQSYITAPTTSLVDSLSWETESLENNKFAARPFAAEAFLGLGSVNGISNRTNPYYTFECLDNARETTARIRILVRDWDRMIPADTSTAELISDISYGEVDAFQDNTYYATINTYEDEVFNDFQDWDDILRFDRTTPGPVFTPINGFFSPLSFPNENRKP